MNPYTLTTTELFVLAQKLKPHLDKLAAQEAAKQKKLEEKRGCGG